MRKYMPVAVVNSLWNAAKNGQFPQVRFCPSCGRSLSAVPVPDAAFVIDVCTGCGFVWFDAGEFQQMPKAPPVEIKKPLPPAVTQRIALCRLEALRREEHEARKSPDEAWKYIPALLGMPVEFDSEETRRMPVATLFLLCVISAVSFLGFAGVLTSAQFGLIPAEWGRMAGLTFLTSFFLHVGAGHLLGNLYFLFVFGDNVEEVLGRTRFLVLLAVSTLVGGLTFVLARPDSAEACVGASGGVSGVLAYYALRFPKHRIGLLFFFVKWLRMPATFYAGFWVLLQILGASGGGRSHVAYEAHIGGLLAGTVWFLAERFSGGRR
jgi:membrane associated rhomboid family serine protease